MLNRISGAVLPRRGQAEMGGALSDPAPWQRWCSLAGRSAVRTRHFIRSDVRALGDVSEGSVKPKLFRDLNPKCTVRRVQVVLVSFTQGASFALLNVGSGKVDLARAPKPWEARNALWRKGASCCVQSWL